MRKLSIEQPPVSLPLDAREWLTRFIVNINSCIDQIHDMDQLTALPKNPQPGMVRYFKAVITPEISSVGFWGYSSGIWTKLN